MFSSRQMTTTICGYGLEGEKVPDENAYLLSVSSMTEVSYPTQQEHDRLRMAWRWSYTSVGFHTELAAF